MKKFILSSAAIVMAFSFSAFAGTPETKGDAKAKVEATTEAATATVAAGEMYWFLTNNDGDELLDPSGIPLSQTPSATPPCPANVGDHCAKGFALENTHISGGKRVPTPPVSSGKSARKP